MTDKIDDGGPAFPRTASEQDRTADLYSEIGMSLRDYFAAAALTGLATMIDRQRVIDLANGVQGGRIEAAAAYTLADAMLAARPKVWPSYPPAMLPIWSPPCAPPAEARSPSTAP